MGGLSSSPALEQSFLVAGPRHVGHAVTPGLGYTWLTISPFSGTKTCTGAPSGDLRDKYTVATCQGQEERRDL